MQRRLNRNSEPQGSIESGKFTYHYSINDRFDLAFLCICNRSYPRKLAFTYLSDLQTEFENNYKPDAYSSPTLRPYALNGFDKYIQQTKETYQDTRATQNLDKLNSELKDVTKVMTKNIEDLLYRGDSLERMGDMSSRLREDSKKYRKAAVRINWELLLKQVGTGCSKSSRSLQLTLCSTVPSVRLAYSSSSLSGGGSCSILVSGSVYEDDRVIHGVRRVFDTAKHD